MNRPKEKLTLNYKSTHPPMITYSYPTQTTTLRMDLLAHVELKAPLPNAAREFRLQYFDRPLMSYENVLMKEWGIVPPDPAWIGIAR